MLGSIGHQDAEVSESLPNSSAEDKSDSRTSTTAATQLRWGIVVLNWNEAAVTLDCANSVDIACANTKTLDFEKIIVDNGSSASELSTLSSSLATRNDWELLTLPNNRGYAAGMNAGYQRLQSVTPCERILFLNNDATLNAETLSALVMHLKGNETEVLTGLANRHNGPRSCFGYRYLSWLGIARSLDAPTDNIDYPSGAALLIGSELLSRCGGLPAASFLYFEELRLVNQLGPLEKFGVCAGAWADHRNGFTASTQLSSPSRHYYAALSCFKFTRDHYPVRLPSVMFTRLLGLLLISVREFTLTPLLDCCRALGDFFVGRERRPKPQ